jgi:hypothetical protein
LAINGGSESLLLLLLLPLGDDKEDGCLLAVTPCSSDKLLLSVKLFSTDFIF